MYLLIVVSHGTDWNIYIFDITYVRNISNDCFVSIEVVFKPVQFTFLFSRELTTNTSWPCWYAFRVYPFGWELIAIGCKLNWDKATLLYIYICKLKNKSK